MQWTNKGANFYRTEIPTNTSEKLKPSIYALEFDGQMNCFYLKRIQECFTFNYKKYELDTPFIKRAVKSFNLGKRNLGILLYGLKGTGKSVTAKTICNEVGVPVILITQKYTGINTFLNSISQDCVIFIDEYEKIYKKGEDSDEFLTLMDGVLESDGTKKLFMLTSNSSFMNDALVDRPGRIRYKKEYSNLKINTIIEVVDDILVNKSFREEAIKYISTLKIITIDIIKAVLEEINLHEEVPDEFKDVFNLTEEIQKYDLYKVLGEEEFLFMRDVQVDEKTVTNPALGHYLYINQTLNLGLVKEVTGNRIMCTSSSNGNNTYIFRKLAIENKAFRGFYGPEIKGRSLYDVTVIERGLESHYGNNAIVNDEIFTPQDLEDTKANDLELKINGKVIGKIECFLSDNSVVCDDGKIYKFEKSGVSDEKVNVEDYDSDY